MENSNKGLLWGAVVVAIVIAAVLVLANTGGQRAGNTSSSYWQVPYYIATNSATSSYFAGSVKIGAAGTAVPRVNAGLCNIHTGSGITTIAATTTATLDCQGGTGTQTALAGVTAADKCFVTPATTTPTTVEGLPILSASASSTQGYIVLKIFNGTGATYTWASAATSSLQYLCIGT